MEAGSTPGRSRLRTKLSPCRYASIGTLAARVWLQAWSNTRSNSRIGSNRINMLMCTSSGFGTRGRTTIVNIMSIIMLIVKGGSARMSGVARPDPRALDALVAEWLAGLRSANTRAAYRADFARFAGWCAEHRVDPMAVDAPGLRRYRTAVERSGASTATTARRPSAIASFGAFARERGATGEFADVSRPTVTPRRAPGVLDDADADAMLRAADELATRTGVLVRLL